MSIFLAILTGLAMGLVFGFALEKSRVFEPGVIVGQMQMRNFTMLKIFLAAVVSGLVVLAALQGFGYVRLVPKATIYGADIVGGLILGAGIALAGACPGTVLAQIGAGYRDAWATLVGGLLGALVYSYLDPTLAPMVAGGPGRLTFDILFGLPFAVAALVFAAILVGLLVVLEAWRPWRSELGANFDGLRADRAAQQAYVAGRPAPAAGD
ncbi:MAG: YeeE/YedE family protein [Alphaproteobacteria bacterium]|nr:YeeE/YedE family protein [Alphaproteobacteria bacterium]